MPRSLLTGQSQRRILSTACFCIIAARALPMACAEVGDATHMASRARPDVSSWKGQGTAAEPCFVTHAAQIGLGIRPLVSDYGCRPSPAVPEAKIRKPSRSLIKTMTMQEGLQDSERLLSDFDHRQQQYAREHKEGFGGGTSATKFSESYEDRESLREAVLRLTRESETVMLGICAESAERGVGALKDWVTALKLPRGRLHGMDEEGVPMDMSNFGAVYIKYFSRGGEIFEPGDANLNGYDGSYRGVYFNPVLPDGEFRQYAVLPLDLFHDGALDVPHVLKRTALTVEEVQELLLPVQQTLNALGGFVSIASVHPDSGLVDLEYSGPAALKYGVSDALLASPHIKQVQFID